MHIFLQPCASRQAQKNYEKTIKNYVLFDENIKNMLTEEQLLAIKKLIPDGRFHVWGVRDGVNNRNKIIFNKMKTGDMVLFAADKKIISKGIVSYCCYNEPLANYLWGTNSEDSWPNIYFISKIINMDMSYTVFNRIVGYKQTNCIQGFTMLGHDRCNKFLEDNLDDFDSQSLNKLCSFENNALSIAVDKGDKKYVRPQRAEQQILRRKLFGFKLTDKCGICGKELPIDLLVAAHIKMRSECSEEEKKDGNIVMPMCKLGCDDLYEKGYILVDEGIIKKNPNIEITTEAVENYLSSIIGNEISNWDQSKKYFLLHNEKFSRK